MSPFQLRWVTLVYAITLLTFGAIAHAEIYKWVDGDGKVQFSDEPPVDRLPSVVHEIDREGIVAERAWDDLVVDFY